MCTARNPHKCRMSSAAGEADVAGLLALLAPVMSLQTQEDRLKAYQEAWARLNPAAEKEEWKIDMAVNYPWSSGKVDLWRTLRRDIESKFRTVLREHLNGECTDRPVVDFSFMHYSDMLLELLDKYLQGLDKYIVTQEDIEKVTADMDAYPEDMRYLLEKGMRRSRVTRAQDFFDVILFMHAVPQRLDGKWDALDHEWDVTWFREHAEVYRKNEELTAFLRDCAVVVLLVGCFCVCAEVQCVHGLYVQLATGVA
jgi:hypothetical protein